MSSQTKFIILLAMVLTMVAIRSIPIMFIKKKIQNKFLKSFFAYIPYAVLTALIVPEFYYSTSGIPGVAEPISACIGIGVAVILAYFERGLLTVSVSAVAAVFITQTVMRSMGMMF